jgi:hypothetical protein
VTEMRPQEVRPTDHPQPKPKQGIGPALRELRRQHARAFAAWEATRSHKWAAEVARLNFEITKRQRPCRKSTTGNPRYEVTSFHPSMKRGGVAPRKSAAHRGCKTGEGRPS